MFNPKKVVFRLNDVDFFLNISLAPAVLDIYVAQLLHLVSETSDMDAAFEPVYTFVLVAVR